MDFHWSFRPGTLDGPLLDDVHEVVLKRLNLLVVVMLFLSVLLKLPALKQPVLGCVKLLILTKEMENGNAVQPDPA